ncbi:MAG: hypothetical protein E7L01_04255 [Paenibacillus macerans]|uniref:Lipoprotein n=2 Tax=Paenibacillus TaxID=44249 RepID=A0A3P3U385_9BACL|nr:MULTISPECIES: hypothetical protein [Paenibacillus]MDU7472561.1 hypothetical protein [Paenibacillus macerans]MEC0329747.1 hypothetical protein [Paenibacillus macerans]RRJ64781.1 hypothetical protein EHV15_19015 [Paenibacillus oralis]GIP12158.1 hypothetical protein J1TS5_43280 [Paenibacillus macerans]
MNKVIFYTVTGIVTLGILTSCANGKNKDHVQEQNETQTIDTNTSQNQQTENNDSFQTGVVIDFDAIDNSLFNAEIKTLLKTTLEAMANKDEESYRSVFRDTQSADTYMYLFGKDYYYDYLGTIEQDRSGRIVVEVRGKVKDDHGIRETPNGFFYFIKNKEGHWVLGAID